MFAAIDAVYTVSLADESGDKSVYAGDTPCIDSFVVPVAVYLPVGISGQIDAYSIGVGKIKHSEGNSNLNCWVVLERCMVLVGTKLIWQKLWVGGMTKAVR